MIDTDTFLWTMSIFAMLLIASLPSTTINGLVATIKSASVGFFLAAGILLCYLAYVMTPR